MKIYHGSKIKFNEFDHSFNKSGNGKNVDGFGFYFSEELSDAVSYANYFKTFRTLLIDGKKLQNNFLDVHNNYSTEYLKYVELYYNGSVEEQTEYIKNCFLNEDNFDKTDIYENKRNENDILNKFSENKFQLIRKKVLEAKTVSTFYEGVGFVYEVEVDSENLIYTEIELSKTIKHTIQQRLYAEGFGRIKLVSTSYWDLIEEIKKIEKISKKKNVEKFISMLLFRCGITGIKLGKHYVIFDRKILKILKIKQYK